jgi:hypothetical protein
MAVQLVCIIVNGHLTFHHLIVISHLTKYIFLPGILLTAHFVASKNLLFLTSVFTANFSYLLMKFSIALSTFQYADSDVVDIAFNKEDPVINDFPSLSKYLSNAVVDDFKFPDGVFCTVYGFVTTKLL